jgi:hypothetical protein
MADLFRTRRATARVAAHRRVAGRALGHGARADTTRATTVRLVTAGAQDEPGHPGRRAEIDRAPRAVAATGGLETTREIAPRS